MLRDALNLNQLVVHDPSLFGLQGLGAAHIIIRDPEG